MNRLSAAVLAVALALAAGPAWTEVTITSTYRYDDTGWAYGINYHVSNSYGMAVCVYPYVTYNANL